MRKVDFPISISNFDGHVQTFSQQTFWWGEARRTASGHRNSSSVSGVPPAQGMDEYRERLIEGIRRRMPSIMEIECRLRAERTQLHERT